MFEIFTFPFMQRALVVGVTSAALLGWMGVYVISRHLSFIGDGIAHASLAAIAVAVLLGWAPLPVALVFSIVLAVILFLMEKKTNISRDTAIGILFVVGMALGIILLQFHQGYVPELISFLFGNILAIRTIDLSIVLILGACIGALLFVYRKQLTFITVDAEGAQLAGVNRNFFELLLYILTALTVVLSIKVVGIVLVSALLVIPSAISKSFAKSFIAFQWISIVASVLIVVVGLILSYVLDLPSGATIVLVGALSFFVVRLLLLKR
ncbi:MAG: metal ABC transporter permease [Candidatus Nomurabacteria bacterium]|nr:MAG: metal ABC transporter permease [Candidatus Nomurabacteria bacterium]